MNIKIAEEKDFDDVKKPHKTRFVRSMNACVFPKTSVRWLIRYINGIMG